MFLKYLPYQSLKLDGSGRLVKFIFEPWKQNWAGTGSFVQSYSLSILVLGKFQYIRPRLMCSNMKYGTPGTFSASTQSTNAQAAALNYVAKGIIPQI